MCCRVDGVCLDDTYGRDEWKGNDVDTGCVWRGASRDKSSCMCGVVGPGCGQCVTERARLNEGAALSLQ